MGKHTATALRAESWFILYWRMGPDRSLEKLAEFGSSLGLKSSLNTLKRWSSDFGWQARVIDFDAKACERTQEQVLDDVVGMNMRQALLGRSMQIVAQKRIDLFKEVPATLDASDVARMADLGVKIERLAMGQVTGRREVMLSLLNVVILPLCDHFKQVNTIPDEVERLRRFAAGADDVVDKYLVTAPAEVAEAV